MTMVAYVRTATSDYESILRQKKRLMAYVRKAGLTIVEYIEVRGISSYATISSRKIDELYKLLKVGDVLLVSDPNRLSRDVVELSAILHLLKMRNVEVRFVPWNLQ